jgi:hypothetical protein
MASSPHSSSLHEAAHVVAAHALGIAIREVTLDPPRCLAQVPDLDNPVDAWMIQRSAMVGLAGLAMDAILGVDQEQGYAETMAENSDYVAACEMVDALQLHHDEYVDAPGLLLERLAGRTRDLLIGRPQQLALVASEMERHRTLTGAEAVQIIETGQPLPRPPRVTGVAEYTKWLWVNFAQGQP